MKHRRILHLWFPCLPLDRLIRAQDLRLDGPFAITREVKGAQRLLVANAAATQSGLKAGMSLADARAICPDLLSEPEDAARDALLLAALRRWADQFSPKVEISLPDALVLDMSGIAHLYGGEPEFLKAVKESLEDLRITCRSAVADTPTSARAWARFRPARHAYGPIIPFGKTVEACDALPVEALETEATEDLRLLGLNRIGEVRQKPSAELARRFGLHLTDALDRLIGRRPEPMRAETQSRPFATRMTLPDPIGLIDDVVSILERIATPLMSRLEREGLGALGFGLCVTCPSGQHQFLSVGFSRPSREVRALLRQMRPKLETLSLPFGAERFRLEALDFQPIQTRQIHLGQAADAEDAIDRLTTVIGNRLGFDRIRRPAPSHSHRPERECASEQVRDNPGGGEWPTPRHHRPLEIFDPEFLRVLESGRPPTRFEWRRKAYTTLSHEGPERVAPEWWADDPGPLSDYFTVKTREGPKLWLRRLPLDPKNEWSVAGRFA